MSFLLAGCMLWAVEARPGSDAAFEESILSISFESLDTASLQPFKPDRLETFTDAQFQSIVRHNLTFIYHNKLNRDRFLVAPDPQAVVDRMGYILEAIRRLNELVMNGPAMGPEGESESSREFVRELRISTKDLKDVFNSYFVEGYSSTYILKLSASRDPAIQWSLFLLESRKICRELNLRLLDYFLNPAPEAISLKQFQSSSINTLVDALLLLTDSTSKRIRGIK